MSITERILKCVEENGIIILEDGNFDNLDSLTFISSVIALESEFDIEFPDEYLSTNIFSSLENVALIVNDIINNKSDEN